MTEHNSETLDDDRVNGLEKGLPFVRGNVTVNHVFPGGTRLLVRGSHWDGVFERLAPYSGDKIVTTRYPGRQLLDFEVAQTFADNYTLTVGAQNALNTYPGEFPLAAARLRSAIWRVQPVRLQRGVLLHQAVLQLVVGRSGAETGGR